MENEVVLKAAHPDPLSISECETLEPSEYLKEIKLRSAFMDVNYLDGGTYSTSSMVFVD